MSTNPSDLPYRPCAGMMVFNRQGLVFTGRRIDQSLEAWQLPQGGIDEGEDPREAALRELEEEIGTRNVAIRPICWELPGRADIGASA
jgi:putative (di)nucleoside polyphosphate hydrolase